MQNYFVIDLHQDGTFEFNQEKNRNGSRCSDWWTYGAEGPLEGGFQAAVQPKDGGERARCQRGAARAAPRWHVV